VDVILTDVCVRISNRAWLWRKQPLLVKILVLLLGMDVCVLHCSMIVCCCLFTSVKAAAVLGSGMGLAVVTDATTCTLIALHFCDGYSTLMWNQQQAVLRCRLLLGV
jgi:hypothetical protein